MSEEVSYTTATTAVSSGGSVSSLQTTLRRHGLFSIDRAAWADAEERVRQLHQALSEEMASCHPSAASRATDLPAAMLAALNRVRTFRAMAEKHHAADFKALHDDLIRIRAEAAQSPHAPSLAAQAGALRQRVEALGAEIQTRLCRIEGEAVLHAATAGLQRLGYAVETRGGRLRAIKAQTCVWAEVGKAGQLTMDFSGFSGLACLNARQAVEAELAKEGVRLSRRGADSHGRPEGGVLAGRLRPLFWDFEPLAAQAAPVAGRTRPLNGICFRR
jgi:hypothetical protein